MTAYAKPKVIVGLAAGGSVYARTVYAHGILGRTPSCFSREKWAEWVRRNQATPDTPAITPERRDPA